MDKLGWLKLEFLPIVRNIQTVPIGKWGKLSFHEMIEHFSDSVKIANGTLSYGLLSPLDKVDSFKAFAVSDRPFKENTPNKLMGEEPLPLRHSTTAESINELEKDFTDFFEIYENKADLKITNPFFGEMSYEDNINLLYKHARHHLQQFDLIEQNE